MSTRRHGNALCVGTVLILLGAWFLFDGLGYQVLPAKDSKTALAALAGADGVDLLLTDVMMPGGMSGPALAAWRAKIGH